MRSPIVVLALAQVVAVVLHVQAAGAQEAAPTVPRLAAPAVTWETLAPYVVARIVPTLKGGDFTVTLCTDVVDTSAVTPWRSELAAFAEVLTLEVMRDDPRVFASVDAVARRFRSRLTALTDAERALYRRAFWDQLLDERDFAGPLRDALLRARRAGFLECRPCAENAAFRPIGLLTEPCRDCPP